MNRIASDSRLPRAHRTSINSSARRRNCWMPFAPATPEAVAEVNAHYRAADRRRFALHDAQLVLARAYGFESWPKLKAYVDGVTVQAPAGGGSRRTTLADGPGHAPRAPGAGQHGHRRRRASRDPLCRAESVARDDAAADAARRRCPRGHPSASRRHGRVDARRASAATTRSSPSFGKRSSAGARRQAETSVVAAPAGIFGAGMWESGRALRMLEADPALARSTNLEGCTPLHAAACALHEGAISWLLDHGADPNHRARDGRTPLDLAASGRGWSKSGERAKFERARLAAEPRRSPEPDPGRRAGRRGVGPCPACGRCARRHNQHPHRRQQRHFQHRRTTFDCGPARPARYARPASRSRTRPDERIRVDGMDEIVYTAGNPLLSCVVLGKRQMAEMLLARGADPNANVYTCGSPLFRAYSQKDWDFVRLLEQHGGLLDAVSAGFACQIEAARQLLADEAAGRLRPDAVLPGSTVSEDLLWTACGGGDAEIVRLALKRIDWPRQDSRWLGSLWQAFTCDDVERGLACFRLVLDRADPNHSDSGQTILHTVMARGETEHVPFAEMLLDQGARIDIRDELLQSTALGWACRWGRVHFVKLLLERGADPVEKDAQPWATPRAWAQKMKHDKVLQVLLEYRPK